MKSITLMDGATGTRLWQLAEEAGLEKVSTWRYNVEQPQLVEQAAAEYIAAGSRIILTNTFNSNTLEIDPSCGHTAEEVVKAGVHAALRAASGSKAKVALDIGPLTELLEPYGELEAGTAAEVYAGQMAAGVAAGAELIFLETFMDLELMRLAAAEAKKFSVPVFCSMTFGKGGRTMFGNSVEAVVDTLSPLNIDALGLNCSLGPEQAVGLIRRFSELTDLPLIFKPNAGMPVLTVDGTAKYDCSPELFARQSAPAMEYATYIGGCCGTDAAYIRALSAVSGPYTSVRRP